MTNENILTPLLLQPIHVPVDEPRQILVNPVFKDFENKQWLTDTYEDAGEHALTEHIGAILLSSEPWSTSFKNQLPEDITGLYIHVHSTCGDDFTYRLNGWDAEFGKLRRPRP